MPVAWLEVPHFQQTADGTCLEACVCMVLAYLQSPVLESKVSTLFESDEIGTPTSRILRLETWGFKVTYGAASLQDIRDWLIQGSPPIAFAQTQFLDYWIESTPHAVVVVAIDDGYVYLNDPAFDTAPQTCALDSFLAAWIEMDEVAATITRQ